MRTRLTEKGVAQERAVLFPNWVDGKEIFPLECLQRSVREAFRIPEDRTVILYSGNMGRKHGLETVIAAARELQSHQHLQFVLCGEGAARADLEMAGRDLPNIQFLPLQPPEKLNQLLNSADIHILPQMADAADLVMPSKLLGMLASGKPIIATANQGTEIGNVVCETGILVPPGDSRALCAGILGLAASPQTRMQFGEKGRALVCEKWGMENTLAEFELRLHELINRSQRMSKPKQRKTYTF
jgi:colanic acid biosynthesis glycosyl transferase WcaI